MIIQRHASCLLHRIGRYASELVQLSETGILDQKRASHRPNSANFYFDVSRIIFR